MKRRYWVVLGIFALALVTLTAGRSLVNRQYSRLEYIGGTGPVTYRFPGEFERQQAIWLQWPSETYDAGNRPVSPTIITIIKAFAPYVRVNLMVRDLNELYRVKKLLASSGYTGTNVHYYPIYHLSIWTRDVGPIFVKDSQNKLHVVNFNFNNYGRDGNTGYINVEKQVDVLTAKYLKLPVTNSTIVTEGGGIESNGRGTLMTTESVALSRNPGMTKQQIENEYKRVLGVKKVIWLKKGLSDDDYITAGHINEFARFADPNTILLAQVLPGDRYTNYYSKEDYLRMEQNYNILKNSTDQDGKPFRIVRIPMPPTLYGVPEPVSGRHPVRSYLNYAVTNGAVLVQVYWKSGRSNTLKTTEQQVLSTFRSVFPGRTVIGIDTEKLNLWGGGIHCITQHMPAY